MRYAVVIGRYPFMFWDEVAFLAKITDMPLKELEKATEEYNDSMFWSSLHKLVLTSEALREWESKGDINSFMLWNPDNKQFEEVEWAD